MITEQYNKKEIMVLLLQYKAKSFAKNKERFPKIWIMQRQGNALSLWWATHAMFMRCCLGILRAKLTLTKN